MAIGWDLYAMTSVLTRERRRKFETDTPGRKPCEDNGRDWSNMTQKPRNGKGCRQKLGKRHGMDSPSEP